jgi:ATP-dependent RNA helicase SUPV3L1/SUV3
MRDALAASDTPSIERDDWVEAIVEAEHVRFHVAGDGTIHYVSPPGVAAYDPVPLGRLTRGSDPLHPEIKLALPREVAAGATSRILRRLRAWSRDMVDEMLGALQHPDQALSAAGRGLVYQLAQSLGTIEAASARPQLRELSDQDHAKLLDLDVVLGRRHVYVSSLLEPDRVARRMALCTAHLGIRFAFAPPVEGTASLPRHQHTDASLRAIGYPVCGPLAIRVDLLERLEQRVSSLAGSGPFAPPHALAAWLGCSEDDMRRVILALGYHETEEGFARPRRRSRRGKMAVSAHLQHHDRASVMAVYRDETITARL